MQAGGSSEAAAMLVSAYDDKSVEKLLHRYEESFEISSLWFELGMRFFRGNEHPKKSTRSLILV